MTPFISADFSPSLTLHSQCRSVSLKQLLDFQKCSHLLLREGNGYYGFAAQEQMCFNMLHTKHIAIHVLQIF